ncbi:hypothetical protein J5N97_026822 [Dioscorea zingiberensis]|uniref:Clp R domain-containing protein n=1 Tax=Dioscorea zingiberensis TaxID=325984 RepID=A0A9D5C400_9LILI|nr:hypothetical protein J5N97_026822 [Dioscorea zingiberensis]
MRAGLATIHQTLTPAAAGVLTASIAEATRRGHGQTTTLHVAATLLASPSGMLRQACLRSHPTTSHPLQCRALELCFSVALDRLPAATAATVAEPPLSNALVAALKRAQAHQRRGCPESQQQPLLAVRVELEQLVVSILDDPGVSRVMREASFSSPAVKAVIEPKNHYVVHPKLQAPLLTAGAENVNRVVEILSRANKRNPVLVGDAGPASVLKEVLQRIELGEVAGVKARIVTLDGEMKIGVVREMIERERGRGVVVDMGELKWVVEGGGAVVEEMGRVFKRFTGGGGGSLWLVGTATCETYLRCQVYHPCMERDWDLQPISIASRSPLFLRNGMVRNSVEYLGTGMTMRRGEEEGDASRRLYKEKYEKEVVKIDSEKHEKFGSRQSLPPWLQSATGGRPLVKNSVSFQSKPLAVASPPGSPVKTDLVLGRMEEKINGEQSYMKRLLKGVTEKVGWQPEAASAAVSAVLQPKPRGDKWLLFSGSDRVGHMKMASALSKLMFGTCLVCVSFSENCEPDMNLRGRQSVDRIVEAIKHNPFGMLVLKDIDRADGIVRGAIKHAIVHGRLIDSYGREISLGSVVFILTADCPPDELKYSPESLVQCEQKILHSIDFGWHLAGKRKANWLSSSESPVKPRKDTHLSFDLNLAAGADEDSTEASQNSSDLTVDSELEYENSRLTSIKQLPSPISELIKLVDYTIVFKPFDPLTAELTMNTGNTSPVLIDNNVFDQMLGSVCHSGSTGGMD